MAEPLLNHRHIDSGESQVTGRGVAPPMNGMYFLVPNGRRLAGCRGQVLAGAPVGHFLPIQADMRRPKPNV
jgi:hypothetical protein